MPDWQSDLKQYLSLLRGQLWFTALAILSFVSTVSTFVPAFYSRFYVPRWVPFLVFIVAFFVANLRLYRSQKKSSSSEVVALKREIDMLQGGSFDGQKRAQAQKMVEGYTSNQRDLLRYILTHGNPTVQMICGATRITQEQVSRNDLQPLEQQGILLRDAKERGLLACIIHQRWKVSRTVVGIEDERQGARQIWG
jgi:hypothetical protein